MAMANMEALALSRPSTDIAAATASEHHCVLEGSRTGLSSRRALSAAVSSSRRCAISSTLRSSFLCSITSLQRKSTSGGRKGRCDGSRLQISCSALGENPDWSDADYIVLGLSHCFQQVESGHVKDLFLIEPVPASTLECMENGGATSFLHVIGCTLGTAFKYDISLLPSEFASGQFCENFDFRAKCASRTWKRPHAVKNLVKILPVGSLRSQYNFSLHDKRVVNKERVVTDADNIKQDMSIDVYGRKSEEKEEEASAIASLYNA